MKTDEELHPKHFVVMKIFQGEINPNKTLYGRFCRYVNEILCPVGSIFVYLLKVNLYLYIRYELVPYHLTYICLYEIYGKLYHTTYRQLFHMLYVQKQIVHTTYGQVFYILYEHNVFLHTTYGKFVYVLDGKIKFHNT